MNKDKIQVQFEITLEELVGYFETIDQEYLNQLLIEVNLSQYATKLIERAKKIILRDGSKIIASLFYYESEDEIFISHLSVCKSSERQGLGKTVVESLKSKVRQRVIILEVDVNNINARKFYEIMGFKEKSNRSKKIVMELSWT
ncbi:acetyltransferase [Candidatus Planktophila lacus]|uniref:GNAT family N-acetyltransferase n=1 Tax=Candidatus Planktophila lacus TaxID=1884913 RepID=UPI000BACD701|nr:GNAT family N-acetyltransferase [Candidatus Planktophila lacus]ASY24515.1 acetyltransferase [Candidatus Planktophila lacus]